MALTDTKIRSAKPREKPVKLTDGGGLYLEVRLSGSKLWRYRYRIAGRENVYAVGEYGQAPPGESNAEHNTRKISGRFTLAEARQERDRCRGLVKLGIHPAHSRKAQRAVQFADNGNTFKAVALEWIGKKKSGWSRYYLRQVERFMETDVFPYVGTSPIRSVTAAQLLEILLRVEARGAETVALLIRQWASSIFRYAVATLRADVDPAAALKGAITRPLRAGRLDNVGEPDLCRMIEVNLTAPILLTRAALPLLRQSKDGLVVNVSSGFGMIGAPFYATYGATKAGLALFSEAIRRELSDQGIHVLVIFPTATDTPMMETSRNTLVPRDSADEVARALVDAIQTRKFAVVRGGEARAEQIARNQSDPAALDEHFRQNLRTFEEAVRDHAAM